MIVLIDVARRAVELPVRHGNIARDEDALPRHLHLVEIEDRVVLVIAAGKRIVVHRFRRVLIRPAREHAQALGVHRNAKGERVGLLALLQGLDVRDQHLVRHDARSAEHLGALHRDALVVAIDLARNEEGIGLLARTLGAIGLRVDDDIGEEQIVVAREAVIVVERAGALPVIGLEHGKAHHHACDAARDMIGRAAHEAEMRLGPGLERGAPCAQLRIGRRKLPGATHPHIAVGRGIGHPLGVLRVGLKVVKVRGRGHRVAEGAMRGHVVDPLAAQVNLAAIAQGRQMGSACFDHDLMLPRCSHRSSGPPHPTPLPKGRGDKRCSLQWGAPSPACGRGLG